MLSTKRLTTRYRRPSANLQTGFRHFTHTHAMKHHIDTDAERRLRQSPEFRAKLRALRESIRARHESELATAGFLRRCIIYLRMVVEYWRERRSILPSSRSLFGSGLASTT